MKVIFLIFSVFWIKIKLGYCQYGVYGGVQFQQPTGYQNYQQQQQQNVVPNRGYGYGYGPYSSYGPNNYVNSNYGNSQQPNLGTVLGDVSLAILRSLGEMLMGPEPDPFPYGPAGPIPLNRNNGQNQFGYGVNAGVYAGTYGSGQNVAGPYNNRNSHIGSSYSGFSGWPVIPWNPPFNPFPISTTTPASTTSSSTTTTITPLVATTLLQDLPLASVVELPLLETIES